MNECSGYVGLDVHKDTIAVAVALPGREVYWKLYASPGEARESLEVFRRRYNDRACERNGLLT